ncbi:sigma-54 interaction domain-containing protein [Peptostreptococcus sp. D1]|uniref:sigma-54 interaction domain-containing protein n=1 Tax=Peptostreptococcus sp. D1 TaxID=72304 RepID=UPI0008E6B6F3|nr:sigma 54-interacting transcriptional regulator [Peptostreptococcus sp. D1]SFE93067.1 PAS domain S-box-containing protein [Peptostreptococcus sp. D1]
MNIKGIVTKPIIMTGKDKAILDYNVYAEYVFDNIKNEKSIDDIDFRGYNVFHMAMKKNDLYIVSDDEIEEVFFKNILDNSFDEIFVADGEGIAIYCNEIFEKNYGVKREDLIGKHVNYVLENGYVDVLLFDKVLEEKRTITYKQKTRTGRVILNTSSPVVDDEGNVLFVVENCKDITENEILYNTLNYTKSQLEKEKNVNLKSDGLKNNFRDFKSKGITEIISKINRFVDKDVNILITGASGTGKTSLAKYIHNISNRSSKPFVNINCTTIPENLMESELFGYKKGAFTGALNSGKKGLVEKADGGTIFLDEIGEIPLNLQSKLLELVQEKQYMPIGSTSKKIADIRIIVATNKNLSELVEKGLFREDLYYRLNVVQLEMPKLVNRKDDIPKLVYHFIDYFNKKYDSSVNMGINLMEYFENYSWPGNIRELEHLIEYLVINSHDETIRIDDLPQNIITSHDSYNDSGDIVLNISENDNLDLKGILDLAEKNIIKEYYKKYSSSYKLAEALNISQSTANRLINKYCKSNR